MIELIDQPKIRNWWKDDFKSVVKDGNKHIDTLVREGYFSKDIQVKGVIPKGQGSVVYYVETSKEKYIVKFFHKSGELLNRKYCLEFYHLSLLLPLFVVVFLITNDSPYVHLRVESHYDMLPLAQILTLSHFHYSVS